MGAKLNYDAISDELASLYDDTRSLFEKAGNNVARNLTKVSALTVATVGAVATAVGAESVVFQMSQQPYLDHLMNIGNNVSPFLGEYVMALGATTVAASKPIAELVSNLRYKMNSDATDSMTLQFNKMSQRLSSEFKENSIETVVEAIVEYRNAFAMQGSKEPLREAFLMVQQELMPSLGLDMEKDGPAIISELREYDKEHKEANVAAGVGAVMGARDVFAKHGSNNPLADALDRVNDRVLRSKVPTLDEDAAEVLRQIAEADEQRVHSPNDPLQIPSLKMR